VNPNKLSFRPAQATDIPAIVELVNSAYRGGSGNIGWTTEAQLLDGQRTDEEEITRLLHAEDSIVLLCVLDGEILASVHLERHGEGAYLGMLAVSPNLQSLGLGKRLMAEAEDIVRQLWAVKKMRMQVITLRHDIIAFYERYGYVKTGCTLPFPTSEKYGIQKVPGLMLEYLEKPFYSLG
jgi:ribosomal protein S18 acetylase RimI-like enzyme